MNKYMVMCAFKEGTDMGEVFAVVAEEQAAVQSLMEQQRLGNIHLSLARGTVFIETCADSDDAAVATVQLLPMAKWWNIDAYPLAAAPAPGGAA